MGFGYYHEKYKKMMIDELVQEYINILTRIDKGVWANEEERKEVDSQYHAVNAVMASRFVDTLETYLR